MPLHMAFLPHGGLLGGSHVVPQRGYLLDALWHLVLPVLCLSYGSTAFLTKLTRGSLLENLSTLDYVRTARAKGLDARRSFSTVMYCETVPSP